jgi:hypothetical protein
MSAATRKETVIEDDVVVPGWVVDFDDFDAWVCSDQFPRRGLVSFLDGVIGVEHAMGDYANNQVKGQFAIIHGGLVLSLGLDDYFHNRFRLRHAAARMSHEPDGMFVSYSVMRTRRARLIKELRGKLIQLEGTPDMVLEVVSHNSARKDLTILRERYWRAGIAEYWLADVRGRQARFAILRRGAKGYQKVSAKAGWLRSEVFDREFRVTEKPNPIGNPRYLLCVR